MLGATRLIQHYQLNNINIIEMDLKVNEAAAKDHDRQASAASGNDQDKVRHAVAAAELYIQLAMETKTQAEKTRFQRKADQMITLAERLKLVAVNPDPLGPKSTRSLTTTEKIIVLRSSTIQGVKFPPWDKCPELALFDGTDTSSGTLFTDEYAYTFSPAQKMLFKEWQRPREIVENWDYDDCPLQAAENLMEASNDSDLVQDMVTDCSVVASMSAVMAQLRPGKDSLLRSLMYPFDHEKGRPALSKTGRYVFRMYFNGCFRRVVIDDRLPASATPSRSLFVVDRQNPGLIWPALMEKAYLKIRGGYDFPGSNSGTDLYVLTGWIPEQVYLHNIDLDYDNIWSTMKRAYDKSFVVATLGTPYLSAEEEEALGLVSKHDYAIMDMRESVGVRLLLVKNPWRNSPVWKGISSTTPASAIPEKNIPAGSFWISFDDVFHNFDCLYLNWNPRLFVHRQDHHFTWDLPPKEVAPGLAHNPQYTITTQGSISVWILLSRHWIDDELDLIRDGARSRPDARIPSSQNGSFAARTTGFMALSIYTTTPPGTRLLLPERSPVVKTALVESSHVLLRLDAPEPRKPYTLVITESDLPLPKYPFTLSFLTHSPITVTLSPEPYPVIRNIPGDWTRSTAGGNSSLPSYRTNPSYLLTIPRPTRLSLLLTTSAADLPINITLLHRSFSSTLLPSRRDILLTSGEYRLAACHAFSQPTLQNQNPLIQPGSYIAIPSTFTPSLRAPFNIRIASDVDITVSPLPHPTAGKFRTETARLVLDPVTAFYRAPVAVDRLVRISAVATCAAGGPAPHPCAVRVSLELGRTKTGNRHKTLAVAPKGEGEFADAAMGLCTEDVDVERQWVGTSGGLWIVVEQMGGGSGSRNGDGKDEGHVLQVDILSDIKAVEVGAWESCGAY